MFFDNNYNYNYRLIIINNFLNYFDLEKFIFIKKLFQLSFIRD